MLHLKWSCRRRRTTHLTPHADKQQPKSTVDSMQSHQDNPPHPDQKVNGSHESLHSVHAHHPHVDLLGPCADRAEGRRVGVSGQASRHSGAGLAAQAGAHVRGQRSGSLHGNPRRHHGHLVLLDADRANPMLAPTPRPSSPVRIRTQESRPMDLRQYIGAMVQEGYWDDVEKPAAHDDGDWIRPDGFGMLAIGANYAHEIYATPWLSFLFGGGLGMGFVTGDLTSWGPGGSQQTTTEAPCRTESPAYIRKDFCPDDGTKSVPLCARCRLANERPLSLR